MQEQVIGTIQPVVKPCEVTLEERRHQQWEKYLLPDNPPPGLPQALTDPPCHEPHCGGAPWRNHFDGKLTFTGVA